MKPVLPTFREVQQATAIVLEQRYAERGERMATAAEMEMIRQDPTAYFDMACDEIGGLMGVTLRSGSDAGVERLTAHEQTVCEKRCEIGPKMALWKWLRECAFDRSNALSSAVSVEQERQFAERATVTTTEAAALRMAMAALDMARDTATPAALAEAIIQQGHAALWLCNR